MSELRDYLIEFEWSVPGVEGENAAVGVRLNVLPTSFEINGYIKHSDIAILSHVRSLSFHS